jgi:hypothetical protein
MTRLAGAQTYAQTESQARRRPGCGSCAKSFRKNAQPRYELPSWYVLSGADRVIQSCPSNAEWRSERFDKAA